MLWEYAITANGVPLLDFCDRVVVVTEAMGGKDDTDIKVPGMEGELFIPGKLWESGDLILSTWLKYADEDDDIVHTDGSAGHVYENFSELKRILRGGSGQVLLARTAPHIGEMEILVESIDHPSMGDAHFHYLWTMKANKPFWQGVDAVTVSAGGSHTPAGDGVIDDMIVEFGGDGKAQIGTEYVEVLGSTGSGIEVDVGRRTIKQAGLNVDKWLRVGSEKWLRLRGGEASTVTFTGSVTGFDYFPKWQ